MTLFNLDSQNDYLEGWTDAAVDTQEDKRQNMSAWPSVRDAVRMSWAAYWSESRMEYWRGYADGVLASIGVEL